MAIVGILLSLLLTFAPPALAQEQEQDVAALEMRYRSILSDYRKQEEQFSLAASEYANSHTLASQENAVQQLRSTMMTRADALITYFQLLHAQLDTRPGIELDRKQQLDTQLVTQIQALVDHKGRVGIATDRILINQEADFMKTQEKPMLALSERSQALIKIGAMQAALDQLVVTKQKADSYIASGTMSETTRLEKKRGSEELERTITSVKSAISETLALYDKAASRTAPHVKDDVTSVLARAYPSLRTGIAFLQELFQ